ncbi:MAG: ATP-binding protein, partial [Pseudomonadota bacterium]
MVQADAVLIGEAINNLLDNALRHGGNSMTMITATCQREGDFAAITIYDDGISLQPQDHEKIFARFSQLQPSQGSGLGLAIVQSIVALHEGSVRIDTLENGASITILLPSDCESGE